MICSCDEIVIVVSDDHGENLGELNVWGDHQMTDHWASRVPLIVCWGEEGGPFHMRSDLALYAEKFRATRRDHHAARLERIHG
jgi:hypothetical protein